MKGENNHAIYVNIKLTNNQISRLTNNLSMKDSNTTATGVNLTQDINVILKKHQQSRHDGVRYLCNKCEFQTSQQNYLRVHKRKKHESMIELKIEMKQESELDSKKQK